MKGVILPITKSAKKALRQSQKRRQRNLARIKRLKQAIKTAKKAAGQKSKDAGEKAKQAIILIDKAVKTHIIHQNKASRLKSKLMLKLAKVKMEIPKKPKTATETKKTKRGRTGKKPTK